MSPPSEKEALDDIVEILAELLAVPPSNLQIRDSASVEAADLVVEAKPHTFLVQWQGLGSADLVKGAIDQVKSYSKQLAEPLVPIVAVTFMGEMGRELCRRAGVAWLDLSGNAEIFAPGLRIRVEGRPNRFKRPGRPANVFAPKSSRIARWLLAHPDRYLTQRELAQATNMDEGFTSRIVGRLVRTGLVVRNGSGAVKASSPEQLLDAWQERYRFSKHHIVQGHVVFRSGAALLHGLAESFSRRGVHYAATGLGAAWLMTRFATFRITTFYLRDQPSAETLQDLAFREESRGANVWLVMPNDNGVFHGSTERDGVRCVHPVQVYIDLKSHSERAEEAAAHLRRQLFSKGLDHG